MSMPKVSTSAGKRRLLWTQVPPKVKAAVENLAGGQVEDSLAAAPSGATRPDGTTTLNS
jgi:hypothetical protein